MTNEVEGTLVQDKSSWALLEYLKIREDDRADYDNVSKTLNNTKN